MILNRMFPRKGKLLTNKHLPHESKAILLHKSGKKITMEVRGTPWTIEVPVLPKVDYFFVDDDCTNLEVSVTRLRFRLEGYTAGVLIYSEEV